MTKRGYTGIPPFHPILCAALGGTEAWPLTPAQINALDGALRSIRAEVIRAARKHGGRPFASPHEGYGVLLEEVEEFWDEVKANNGAAALDEVTQVGAMAAFYIASFTQAGSTALPFSMEAANA